jgi:hypothetical protein
VRPFAPLVVVIPWYRRRRRLFISARTVRVVADCGTRIALQRDVSKLARWELFCLH